MAGSSPSHPAVESVSPVEHGAAHGAAVERHTTGHVVSYNPDAPSEAWGWHGSWREFAPRGSRFLLWLGVVGILLFLFGNHISHVEDWWLVAIAALYAGWLIRGEVKIRRDRRRRP